MVRRRRSHDARIIPYPPRKLPRKVPRPSNLSTFQPAPPNLSTGVIQKDPTLLSINQVPFATSQCPPLRPPTLTILPSDFSCARFFSTPRTESPTSLARRSRVMSGYWAMRSRIFTTLFTTPLPTLLFTSTNASRSATSMNYAPARQTSPTRPRPTHRSSSPAPRQSQSVSPALRTGNGKPTR